MSVTLRDFARRLSDAGVESARSDVLALAAHASGMSNASLLARFDYDIAPCGWYDRFCELVRRRAAREPLQYILGKWEFYGDSYVVSPACLIPRPETELLVDHALSLLAGLSSASAVSYMPSESNAPSSSSAIRIADLCCGSGCIGIAVCRNFTGAAYTSLHCDSIDISPDAIAIAIENARLLGVSDMISFRVADATAGGSLTGKYSLILSNPPYIRRGELDSLEPELSHEPRLALDGGHDGLDFYRLIIESCKEFLTDDGAFVFEIGYDEDGGVTEIAAANGFSADIFNDYSSHPRVAVLRKI